MGTGGSSSKRKSSSSLRKKRSKNPSEVRKRKRNRSRIRKNKSKKSRRGDDSISYSDEDYSRSSVSDSSSSSDDGYRRSRSRSRTRRNVKSRRKRARTSSSSPESSLDSFCHRKRKGSKKTGNPDVKKKKKKKTYKKKPKRDVSSESCSCSTCRVGTSSYESEFEGPRGRSKRVGKDGQSQEKVKSGKKGSRYRSRSSSPCSLYSNGNGYRSEEKIVVENNSRRLRSVITFAKEPDEKDEKELDKCEEEIIYDHDEYPCRSGDSNDGGNKKDLAYYSNGYKPGRVEKIKGVNTFTEVAGDGQDAGDQNEESNHRLNGVGLNNLCAENADDLESILRQKALENMRKFRGFKARPKIPAEQNDKSDNDVKQSSSAKPNLLESKSPKEDVIKAVGTASPVDHVTIPKTAAVKSGFPNQNMSSPADNLAVSGNPRENLNTAADVTTDKSELGKPALERKPSGTYSTLKQILTSQSHTSPKANLLVTRGSVDDSLVENSQTVACISNNQGAQVDAVTSSCVPEPSSTLTSTHVDPQAESKGGSQFEEKTMSVMRGGEMVQVNYKVYIPKNVPALGRRQLQR